MADTITLPGTIPGLLCPGMLATGRIDTGSWVTGRIIAVEMPGEQAKYPAAPRCSVGIADNFGMRPFRPEEVEIDLSDPLTLQAVVAWVASTNDGCVVGPHECIAHTFDVPVGHYVTVSYYIYARGWLGHSQYQVDATDETGLRDLALAVRAVALAIHDGRSKVGPHA